MSDRVFVTVECVVNVSVERAWELWTQPEHITKWCFGSPDWHAPRAESDLRAGGKYVTRMEAKDGSFGFDCEGVYDAIDLHKSIKSHFPVPNGNAREIEVVFTSVDGQTKVSQTFEAEKENDVEIQRGGWQNIMNNFKAHAESV